MTEFELMIVIGAIAALIVLPVVLKLTAKPVARPRRVEETPAA